MNKQEVEKLFEEVKDSIGKIRKAGYHIVAFEIISGFPPDEDGSTHRLEAIEFDTQSLQLIKDDENE